MRRALAVVPLALLTAVGGLTAIAVAGAEDPPAPTVTVVETTTQTVTVAGRLQGHGIGYWHHRAKANYRTARGLRRELLRRWDYPHLIALAALTYGVDRWTLERKARCESGGYTDFYNEDSGASGVMQFLPSTWAGTPYHRFSIFDPFANVLAGAWMHSARVHRGGEWECR